MLSDEVINKVTDRLVRRIEQANTEILKTMAGSVKKFRNLTPTQAQQLAQIMYYGGDYDKIVKELAKVTQLNVKDIYKIFEEVAKNDLNFAKQFYKYRNVKFIPWEENIALQNQVNAIATLTAKKYNQITKTIAFSRLINGKRVFSDIGKTYHNLLDTAVINVSQGKSTFDQEMFRTLKDLVSSGIKTVDYESGRKSRKIRIDSAVRSALGSGLRNLHMEQQLQFGEQFDADGVEISVHMNPAPDHELVQGRQFSTNQYDEKGNLIKKGEFEKFQDDEDAISYDGVKFPAISDETNRDRRSIGEYNCYHYIYSIVLGISKPAYSNEELQEMIDNNHKGFDYEGKHYTMYEGTQLQRNIETELRKHKDLQITARAGGFNDEAQQEQKIINQLTKKYKELNEASGLFNAIERARVKDYHRISISKSK